MDEEKKSFKHIFKATSLFGGVQIIQILANLVRGKFIAILLGPAGMGLSSLYTSTTTMIQTISGLGLSFSAVRDISMATETHDLKKISRTRKVFQRWIWFSGLLGAVITIVFSPFLSKVTFGNKEYAWAFVWLSITLLLNALAKGNNTLLQGMRRLRDTAKASVIGSVVGLFVSVPLYYFYGIKGIVPALIFAAVTAYIASLFFTRKIEQEPVTVTGRETIREGQEMVKLGIIQMISYFLGTLAVYVVNTFVRYKGGFADVGLYQAGLSLTNQFVGLVFVAMGSDYFPRLSAISSDNVKVREMVNQQAEIVILIAAPLLIALLVTAPVIIHLLLSPEFYSITLFIRWLAIGMIFKAASYSVGYIAFAKGDKKVFFIVDGVIGNGLQLLFNIVAYNFWGLKGMGISFLVTFSVYFITIQIITYKLYSFSFNKVFFRLFISFLVLCLMAFIFTSMNNKIVEFGVGSTLFIISAIFSFHEIDKRTGLKAVLLSRFRSR
jgi:O-antigen/teichoic acid export membrane protein